MCVCANNTPNGAMKNGGGGGGGIMNGKGDIPGWNGGSSWGPDWPSCWSSPFLAVGPSTTPAAAAWTAPSGTGPEEGRGRGKVGEEGRGRGRRGKGGGEEGKGEGERRIVKQ